MKVFRQTIYGFALAAGMAISASAQSGGSEPRKPPPKPDPPVVRVPPEKPPPKPREENPKGGKPGFALLIRPKETFEA